MNPIYNDAVVTPAVVTPVIDQGVKSRISWSAIFAGVIITLVVQILFTLLGTSIGFSTLDLVHRDNPSATALGVGAIIWWIISALVSIFLGGFIAGRVANRADKRESILHGTIMWAVTTLLAFYLVTSTLGGLLGVTGGVLQSVAGGASQVVTAVAPHVAEKAGDLSKEAGFDFQSLKDEALKVLQQTEKPALQPGAIQGAADNAAAEAQVAGRKAVENPDQANNEFNKLFDSLFKEGQNVVSQMDREALINVIAKRTGQSNEQAAVTADKWIQQYEALKAATAQKAAQLKEQALHVADKAAATASTGSLITLSALILGAFVASYAALLGYRTRDHDYLI